MTIPDRLVSGRPCILQLAWENKGAAPAYHPYTLRIRLDDPATYDFEVDAANREWMWLGGDTSKNNIYCLFSNQLKQ